MQSLNDTYHEWIATQQHHEKCFCFNTTTTDNTDDDTDNGTTTDTI